MLRAATTFASDGSFDEEAFRTYLSRFVEAGLGVYLASGGSGEGHTLTWEELYQVYRVGVGVCKGKVPVLSNQPEQYTARATIEHAHLAIEAGVDAVNIYGPVGSHGEAANETEYRAYFDHVLTEIAFPVVVALSTAEAYCPPARAIAAICNKHAQVTAINVLPPPVGVLADTYFLSLRDALTRDVEIYVHYPGALTLLEMGAAGTIGNEPNILPKTFRRLGDAYRARELQEFTRIYSDIRRFTQYVLQWGRTPRWIKVAMKAFNIPGCGLREPFTMPEQPELERFAVGALALNIPEISEIAKEGGLLA